MKLSDYLETTKTSAAEFGRKIGASRSAVVRWAKGERSPGGAMLRAIMDATGGAVTPNDFFSPLEGQASQARPQAQPDAAEYGPAAQLGVAH